jgi:GTPase SAR1 family protein
VTENGLAYRIGVIGPTRVGKTSLVTSLLEDGKELLAGAHHVEIRPVDTGTEERLAKSANELNGSLEAGEFRVGKLRGTEEPFTFRLLLDPGVDGAGIELELLDYPGTWLDAATRPKDREQDWSVCRRFITQSTVLLVPIDAAVLMEAVRAEQRMSVPFILTIAQVEQVVRSWAKVRRARLLSDSEPALLLLCPLKCESYMADNGGRSDQCGAMIEQVERVYDRVIRAVHQEEGRIDVVCCPVDTIGCVEITSARWPVDEENPDRRAFDARYRVREPRRVSRKGVDDVFAMLCKQLVQARRVAESASATKKLVWAQELRDDANRDEGILLNFWNWLSGESADREERARTAGISAKEAAARVASLGAVVERLSGRKLSSRVHVL